MNQVLAVVGTFLVVSFAPVVMTKIVHLGKLKGANEISWANFPNLMTTIGTCLLLYSLWKW